MAEVFTLFAGLAQNVALLLSLVFGYSLVAPRLRLIRPALRAPATGVLFGAIALIGMFLRLQVAPGVNFDSRNVAVALAGLFGGPVSAATAGVMVIAYRMWLGGIGTGPGVGAILTATTLGALVHWRWGRRVREFGPGQFLLLGAALAGSGLLWTLALPDPRLARQTFIVFIFPVGVLYPLATMLAGMLLTRERGERERTTLVRHSLDHWREAVLWADSTGRLADFNSAVVQLLGYSAEELRSLRVCDLDANCPAEAWSTTWKRLCDHAELRFETSYRARDGRLIPVEAVFALLDFEGEEYACVFVRDITERTRVEAVLRESEARYRLIVETVDEIIYRVVTTERDSFRGTVEFVSGQVREILGYQPEEFQTDPGLWFRIVHPDDLRALVTSTREILTSRQGGTRLYRLRHKATGEYRWMEDKVVLHAGDRGDRITIQGAARDVTERTRLQEEAERRRAAAESLAAAGRLVSQTLAPGEVAERILGSIRALIQTRAAAFYRLEPGTGDLVAVAVSGEAGPTFGVPIVFPKGTGAVGLAIRNRQPVVTPNFLTDPRITLTPEIRARVELATYRSVLAVPLLVKGSVIGALGVGDREGRTFGREEIELAQAFADQAAVAFENARLYEEGERRRRAAESLADVERAISRSLDPREVAQKVVGSVHVLLESRSSILLRLEPELEQFRVLAVFGELERLYARDAVVPAGTGAAGIAVRERQPVLSPDVLTDPRITYAPEERAYAERAAWRAVVSVPLLVHDRVLGALSVAGMTGRVFDAEEIQLVQSLADQAAIALENSRLYGELQMALKELEASQRQIVETERLRALGELASGVAHNFNNALAIVLGRVELLLARTRSPDARRQLQVIEQTAKDAARTVKRIEEFARMRRARPFQAVDLNLLVDEVVELTHPRWKEEAKVKGISYEVATEKASLPPVAGDPSELREALTNLMFNALDAMPTGGRVTFRTGTDGEHAYCAVTDTGIGMTPEVRQRIFDPFFTTKGDRGSGLGLSIVYGVIARHGGRVDAESQAGEGTTFTIRLPLRGDFVEVPEEVSAPWPQRRGKILVIDDEPELLEILGELLTAQGHAVTVCSDGQSGLGRFKEGPFDLVITDLGMPGVSGWEVVTQVKRSRPGTPVALLTGWGDQIAPEEARAKGADFLMTKPFTAEDIRAVLAQALVSEK